MRKLADLLLRNTPAQREWRRQQRQAVRTSAEHSLETAQSSWREVVPIRVGWSRIAEPHRLTIFLDHLDPEMLSSAVGTPLVLGALVVQEASAELRICTLRTPTDGRPFRDLIEAVGMRFDRPVEFVHIPSDDELPLPWTTGDIALVTSWSGAHAALETIPAGKIRYIVQPEEAVGTNGLHRLAEETMRDDRLGLLVSSRMAADPRFEGIRLRGTIFTPTERPDGQSWYVGWDWQAGLAEAARATATAWNR